MAEIEIRKIVTVVEDVLTEGGRALPRPLRLVAAGLTYCVEHPEQAEAEGYPPDAGPLMFMKLA